MPLWFDLVIVDVDAKTVHACFQLLIVWSTAQRGARSLPASVGRYRQFQNWPSKGVELIVHISKSTKRSATSDVEFVDRESGKLVALIEGFECVIDPALETAFRLNTLSGNGVA